MGAYEIRMRLGVSRQRVEQLMKRPDWPEPYEALATGRIWRTEDIEAWIRVHRPNLDDED